MEKKEQFDKEMVLRYTERLLWNDYNSRSEKERQKGMEIGEQLRLIEDEILSLPEDVWCEAAKKLADQGVLVGFFLDACRELLDNSKMWDHLKEVGIGLIKEHQDSVTGAGWSSDEALACAKDMLEPLNEAMLTFHYQAAMGIEDGDLESIFASLLKEWCDYRIKHYTYGF